MATNNIGRIGLVSGDFVAKFCRSGVDIDSAGPLDLIWSHENQIPFVAETIAVSVPQNQLTFTDVLFSRTYPTTPLTLITAFYLSNATQAYFSWFHLSGTGQVLQIEGHSFRVTNDRVRIRPWYYPIATVSFGITVLWYEALT